MPDLRTRLLADRAELVDLLAATPDDRHLDPGLVRMLADVEGALAALDDRQPAVSHRQTAGGSCGQTGFAVS